MHNNGHALTKTPEVLASYCEPSRGRRTMIRAVIELVEECGAKAIPVPDELARAIPLVIAGLMKDQSPRFRGLGAQLAVASLRYNLARYDSAVKTAAAEKETPGNTTTVMIFENRPPGRYHALGPPGST